MLFFASLFIGVFKESGIGEVSTALIGKVLGGLKFTGIPLILIVLILISITNLVCPDSLTKWTILSATIVPLLMNASISPEFSQVIFNAGDSITNGITPIFGYFVIYIALLEKYNTSNSVVSVSTSTRYMVPYSIYIAIIFGLVIVGWYMLGIPIGIGSYPGVIYGA